MRAYNKKKKPKHITKSRNTRRNVFTMSRTYLNEYDNEFVYILLFKFGKIIYSLTAIKN